jgi:hypothetical protein
MEISQSLFDMPEDVATQKLVYNWYCTFVQEHNLYNTEKGTPESCKSVKTFEEFIQWLKAFEPHKRLNLLIGFRIGFRRVILEAAKLKDDPGATKRAREVAPQLFTKGLP